MSLKLKTMTLHVVIAGCMSMAFYAQADVKIGVAGPFTGPNATYGAQYWKGASQAVADINAAGGIKGEKIVLVQGDDACEPKQAVAVPTGWWMKRKSPPWWGTFALPQRCRPPRYMTKPGS